MPSDAPKTDKQQAKDLLVRLRKRFKAMESADRKNRVRAIEDLEFTFVPGKQWDESSKRERGDRPCYEFNKVRPTVKRVVNEMRKNRPAGKVRAVEDGDKDTANIYDGLIRNIWNVSDADTVIDYAGEYQVAGGYGAWRITTKYANEDAFEQDIVIEAIKNPFCLYADNACADPLKRDARDWVLTEKIPKEVYEQRFPNKEVMQFSAEDGIDEADEAEWGDEESVRICEYWYKKPVTKTLYLLQTGEVVDNIEGLPEGIVVKERTVQSHKIMMCIASGDAILEGPTEWAGSQFPFVVVYGDWVVINGEVYWQGLTRPAKDAQRSYNFARTAVSETIALAPQAKFWATPKQAQGLQDMWADSHKKNFPVNLYNPDPQAPGAPQRMGGAEIPVALIQESQIASEEIKAVTGIFDASLGAQSNETSGRAISARQAQGEVATFNFADNMAKGIKRTYEILIDLAPKIIDTERSLRILGVDGAEKYVRVNQVVNGPEGPMTVNDLAKGKYDVTVTVGPSYSTQRMEAAEVLTEIASRDPNFMPVAGDLMFKSMDIPLAEQIAERYRFALAPPIQQALAKEGQEDPSVKAAMAQVDQAMQQVQQHGQLVQAAEQELKELQAAAQGDKASAELARANLKAEEVRLEGLRKDLERAQQALYDAEAMALKEIQHAREMLTMHEKLAKQSVQKAHDDAQHGLEREGDAMDAAHREQQHAMELRDAKSQAEQPA